MALKEMEVVGAIEDGPWLLLLQEARLIHRKMMDLSKGPFFIATVLAALVNPGIAIFRPIWPESGFCGKNRYRTSAANLSPPIPFLLIFAV